MQSHAAGKSSAQSRKGLDGYMDGTGETRHLRDALWMMNGLFRLIVLNLKIRWGSIEELSTRRACHSDQTSVLRLD